MTEYDYSPAAWERYVAQQSRVSNWVTQTSNQAHAYSNPFLLSPTLRDRSFYDHSGGKQQLHPAPTRSKTFTLPPAKREELQRQASSRPSRTRSRSQSVDIPSSSSSVRPRSTRSTPHPTRASSTKQPISHSHTVQVVYAPPPPPTHQPQHTQPYPYPQKYPQPVRQQSPPTYHSRGQSHGSQQRTVYLPPPRPGRSYIIPSGGRLEYQYGPPAPKKPQPLFKRLLGFMSPGSGNGKGGPEKMQRSSGRRSSY